MKKRPETSRQLEGNNMLKHILTVMLMVVTIFTGPALASISQPPVVYYGTAINAAAGATVSIALTGSPAVTLASSTVGSDLKYLLRVPMDDVSNTRIIGTARMDDNAVIFVDGTQVTTVVIPKFGKRVFLDLGSRTAEQWSKDHPGDNGSGDMNRNGVSDLAEYLDGKDPAACIWTEGSDTQHAETTVYHSKVLSSCLKDAGSDQKHNLIRVATGAYPGNFSYTAYWGENYDLTLVGGYDPSGSGAHSPDASLTVLNGDTDNDQIGNGRILTVDTDTSKSSGTVHIESLTFKNGVAATGHNGGALHATIFQGDLEVTGNIFTGNSATAGGAIAAESRGSALVILRNNLIYANSAGNAAVALINSTESAPVILLNNTMVENAATDNGDGRSLLLKSHTASGIDLTNNIISSIAGPIGKDIYISNSDSSTPVIMNNSLSAGDLMVNTPGFVSDPGNVVCNPQFISAANGNYRLDATSECIDRGISHAKLPATDADGSSRVYGSAVDIGAYEYSRYTVSFESNGGNTVAAVLSNYRSIISEPAVPVKTENVFAGWYKDIASTIAWNFAADVVTSNMTLYAKWTVNRYTLSFNSNGGSSVTSVTTDYQTNVSEPAIPVKAGHTFIGWYKEETLVNAWSFTVDTVMKNTVLYAKWNINRYTVSFNSNGGSAVTPVATDYLTAVSAPVAPVKADYVFGGWYRDAQVSSSWNFASDTVTNDITLYAKWIPENGSCGISNGMFFNAAPAVNLCATGTASAVSGTWNWTCSSKTGGTTANCSATLRYQISATLAGTGGGTVSSDAVATGTPADINCTGGTCAAAYPDASVVTLLATPDTASVFEGWSGACTNATGSCVVTLHSNMAVTATFKQATKAMVGSKTFLSLQDAYNDVDTIDNAVIKLVEGLLSGTFTAGKNITAIVEGGYTTSFGPGSSNTTLQSPVVIKSGTVKIKGVTIR